MSHFATFKNLPVGTTFKFASEFDKGMLFLGVARGPWRKLSARKYEHVDSGMQCEVGTVSVEVQQVQLTASELDQNSSAIFGN